MLDYKAIRLRLGLTQRAMADMLHLSPKNGKRWVRAIEAGQEPSARIQELYRLAMMSGSTNHEQVP